MAGYRDLRVWQDSKDRSVRICTLTASSAWKRLRDPIRRAAASIPSNIAEGAARNSQKDSLRFFPFPQGSLAEPSTRREIASEIGYVESGKLEDLQQQIAKLQRNLGALSRKRSESR